MSRHWSFTLPGHPPSINRTQGKHWAVAHKEHAPFKDGAAMYVRSWRLAEPLAHAVVSLTLEYSVRRYRDWDNAVGSCKHLIDGLVLGGLLIDDAPQYITLLVYQRFTGVKQVLVEVIDAPAPPTPAMYMDAALWERV